MVTRAGTNPIHAVSFGCMKKEDNMLSHHATVLPANAIGVSVTHLTE